MEGIAFDVAMANHDPEAFEAAARAVGFQGFGFYPRSGFMHIDLGPARSWGERFPKRSIAFAAETPPAREVLAESRTLKGGGRLLPRRKERCCRWCPTSITSAGCSSPSRSAA
jgi:zinc D-Ala-D-Ala carboxypeptidase